jgi:hypothetical protein
MTKASLIITEQLRYNQTKNIQERVEYIKICVEGKYRRGRETKEETDREIKSVL